jgi:hypothetical protein
MESTLRLISEKLPPSAWHQWHHSRGSHRSLPISLILSPLVLVVAMVTIFHLLAAGETNYLSYIGTPPKHPMAPNARRS